MADLTTGLLNGTFTMTFEDGATLVGNVFEDVSAIITSPSQTGPYTQTLTFTGGTGEFAGATGSFSGNGFEGIIQGTVSGSGTVNAPAIPEPGSLALAVLGITGLIVYRQRKRFAQKGF